MKRLAIAFAALLSLTVPAFAHAAGRGFVMLLPTGWVIAGGALAVLVSFGAVSLLPRLAMKVPALPKPLSPMVAQVMSLFSAIILVVLIVLGFIGPRDPVENLLPLAIWTLWWVEIVMLHPLFGNLWEAINPLRGPAALLTGRFGREETAPPLRYPAWAAYWPAVAIFFGFAWFQLVYAAPEDPAILAWFADSGMPFAMEVTRRTESDKKGGHLAVRLSDGRFLLRESAQCPKADEGHFQNIDQHRYFNTNNLWIDLQALKSALQANDGLIPLPPIMNKKTVDPRDATSPAVVQLETAMGAAIECFAGAGAIEVSRVRFAPVKTTSDLLAVRSDAYELTEDFCLRLHPSRNGQPPHLHLDQKLCKLVDGLEKNFPHTPSLLHCRSLLVHGPVECGAGVVFKGDAVIHNHTHAPVKLKAGVHEGPISVG